VPFVTHIVFVNFTSNLFSYTLILILNSEDTTRVAKLDLYKFLLADIFLLSRVLYFYTNLEIVKIIFEGQTQSASKIVANFLVSGLNFLTTILRHLRKLQAYYCPSFICEGAYIT